MMYWRRLIPGILGILLSAGAVRADMVPIFERGVERQEVASVCDQTEIRRQNLSTLYDSPLVAHLDFDFGTAQFLPQAGADIQQASQVPHSLMDLTGGPGSISLCLYALLGLGLCSAPHWIKKSHFGHIPEWYHDGGPFQIGHSFAVSPETLCPVPVDCFIQPDDTAERLILQYRLRTIVSLWRKSQFVPTVLASRGPPKVS